MKTYNDIFVEELIRRVRGTREMLVKGGAVIASVILMLLVLTFTRAFFPFFFAIICILLFFVFKYTVKEFEYSFINGDLDIDAIWGMRKRKTIFSTGCKNIKVMAPYNPNEGVPAGEFTTVLDASISKKSPGRWYFICQRDDGTNALVYFNPSERLRAAFKTYLGVRMRDS